MNDKFTFHVEEFHVQMGTLATNRGMNFCLVKEMLIYKNSDYSADVIQT